MIEIANYEILETISDNYKKVVYRCKDIISHNKVILKVLKSEFSTYEEVMRFKREYNIMSELCDKIDGVIKPYGLEEQNGRFIMVLQDIEGKSLKKIIADENLDIDTLLNLSLKIVEIIGGIHENKVIHKDIKPSNIIWNREKNIVQVIDFELATKLSKERYVFENNGVFEGSIPYISPEQTGRMNRNVDNRTDFYSLGAVFYEMFTGKAIFDSEDVIEQIYSIIAKVPISPYELTKGKISKNLSNIIMKLLEKSPENRYRSSYGIKADLKKCIEKNEDFEIGKEDKLNIFQIPQKIYGREEELRSLVDIFKASIKDASKIMLVSGEAGVGKTALVSELHKYIGEEKGFFIEGKFEQYNKNMPYSAITAAFKKLIIQLLKSNEKNVKKIKKSLNRSLGQNGGIITNLIPELEKLIGVQNKVEHLNPAEETNRFFMTFVNFIEGITYNENPLVLFLDDLQWADVSSIELLQKLMLQTNLKNLFVICSYRCNEVSEIHPFITTIEEIRKVKEVREIYLNPLSNDAVCSLMEDTLNTKDDNIKEFCEIIYSRTKGNPFFVNEILKDLYKKEGIVFDDKEGKWTWKINEIEDCSISDNVVDFLISRIKTLPIEVQKVVSIGSIIGNVFNFKLLQLVCEENTKIIVKALTKAVEDDIILPLDKHYHIFYNFLDDEKVDFDNIQINFVFQHDKIQQALYQLIDSETRKKLHLNIGEILLKSLKSEEVETQIIDIATHINKGIEFVSGKEQLDEIIKVNLRAAKRAKETFAYNEVFKFVEKAKILLPLNCWETDNQLTFEIFKLYCEAAYLTRNIHEAEKTCVVLLNNLKDSIEIAKVYEMQANYYTYLGMMKESIEALKSGLKNFGINIPEKVNMVSVLTELIKVKTGLRGKTIEELLEAPEIRDEKIKLIMRLLIGFIPPAFISGDQNLFALAVLKKANLTLKYGNCAESAGAYVGYAILLSGLGDLKGAFDFGRLAIRINDKFNDLQWRSLVYVLYTLFCHTWNEPWETLEGWYKKAIDSSLNSGDLLYLAHACYYVNLWSPTIDIEKYISESSKYIAMIENTKYKEALATTKLARQKFLNLAGELNDNLSFNDEFFNEENYLKQLEDAKYYSGIAIYYIYKIEICFIYEGYEKAFEYIEKADKIISTLAGSTFMEEFSLYSFLNIAYSYDKLNYFEKIKAKRRIYKEYKRVKKWAKNCPENFLQHELIMKAEIARISKKHESAEKYYNLAVEASEKGSFVRYKALAHELFAKFYYNRNLKEIAAYFFRQASYYYSVWGAKEKVTQLERKYADITDKINKMKYQLGRTESDSTKSVDLHSIIMASQAISKEIELDNLLEVLMEIVIKNAGAQRGCIIMKSNSNLLVEGEYKSGEENITVLKRDAMEFNNFPQQIINYVSENKESLIYNDAFSETKFVNDPYIIKNKPKSLLCMPLMNQNKITAIIYLENNLVEGTFVEERIKVINLLSREMVFSIENASLYSDLERSEEELRRHRDYLEDLVAERTKELENKNKELSKYIHMIEKISITDELTGLYNRRHFNEIFFREVNRARRNKEYFTFIMLDVDYFKKYNDTYGHYQGDIVLQKVGFTIIEHAKRASDFAFRLGGEEFGIILSALNSEQSFKYADGIRKDIEELKIEHKKNDISKYITVSVGLAVIIDKDLDGEDIYKLVDHQLYNSKASGRNRVTMIEK